MKVIDLLNKIAKGEEEPKKIKYHTRIYEYNDLEDDYSYFMIDHYEYLLDNINTFQQLNDEVEIIEEKDIEELELCMNYEYEEVNDELEEDMKKIVFKINELVREVIKLKRQNEK